MKKYDHSHIVENLIESTKYAEYIAESLYPPVHNILLERKKKIQKLENVINEKN